MLKLKDLALRPDFKVGPLTISPPRRLVEGPGGSANVEPLIMQVLLLLLDGRGQVVTRDELFDQCWGGAAVGDDSLNRAIGGVRRVFDQVAPGQVEIETVPRTGYRATGPIFGEADGDAPSTAVSRRRAVSIGLGAAAVAAGGGAFWILRGNDGARYDELVGRGDQILRYALPSTQQQAVDLLRRAVALEPRDPRAWGLLAYALADGTEGEATSAKPDVLEACKRAAATALALNPRESNALLARLMLQHSPRDWAESDLGLRRVLQVDGRNTFAIARLAALLQSAGLNQESWDWNERAIAIDPISPTHQFRRALKHWINGRVPQADVTIDRLVPLWPNHSLVWNARFLIYAFTDRTHAALAMINDEEKRPRTLTPLAVSTWRLSLAALTERTPATITRAHDAIRTAGRQAPGLAAYGIMTLSALGEVDAAFSLADGFLLSRGAAFTRQPANGRGLVNSAGWRSTQWLFTPPSSALRADARFTPLCDGIGLTHYWRVRKVTPDYLREAA